MDFRHEFLKQSSRWWRLLFDFPDQHSSYADQLKW